SKLSVVDGQQVSSRLQGRSDEYAGWWFPSSATQGAANDFQLHDEIVINEIAPSTDPSFWLELVNTGDTAVELDGYVITVDGVTSNDYTLPAQLLAPGALTVITEAQLQFDALDGDRVYVYTPSKLSVVDGQQVSTRLQGRSDEYAGWWFPSSATQGAANDFQLHDEIVINEIMYHHQPSNSEGGGYVDDDEQWIELYNRGAQSIDLTGWGFGDGVTFDFAPGTLIAPNDYVVVADNPVVLAAEFPANANKIVGDFSGGLSNRGERITLLDDSGNPADQVRYYDDGYWHPEADGDGSSLELRDPDADNSVALAWAPSDESSKSAWQTYSYTMTATDPLHGPAVNFQEFRLGLLNDGVFLIDDIEVIQRPGINDLDLMQNGDFESGDSAWRFVGTHGGSQVIVDPDDPGNNVLRVEVTGPRHYVNDVIESTLAGGVSVVNGWEYEISYRAKWISGSNQVNTELFHGRVAKTTLIDVPQDVGTPGTQNSQFVANAGPTYTEFIHGPVVPNANQAITVSTFISDPDGIGSATLWYRPNGGSWTSLSMSLGGDGKYFASIPGQSAGTIVQFYVEATDTLGAISQFPEQGADSRALVVVQDNKANASKQNVRVIMLNADTSELYAHENIISDKRFGATVIYNESEVYYDAGVRLRGSHFSRNNQSATGYNIQFQPDQLFRGVHETIGIKKTAQQVLLVTHMLNAANDVPGNYDDVVHFIGPGSSGTGTAILMGARYTDVFLDSQFANGGDGTIYSLKKIRDITQTVDGPAASNPESLKLGWPIGSGPAIDIDYRGTDKEQYRWQFEIRSSRGRDDYSKLIELADILQLNGAALQAAAPSVIDVDQFMRVLAMASLAQPWDFYTAGVGTKNFMFYAPPGGGPLKPLPWDWDSSFSNNNGGTSAPLFGGGLLSKITALPVYTRLLHGHLLDIINTTYNSTYMSTWTSHYGSVQGSGFGSQLSFIAGRSAFVANQLPSQIPFEITTNGGNNFSTASDSVTLTGDGWIDVREIHVNGQLNPLPITWLDADTWEVTVPVAFGANNLMLEALNHQGEIVGTDSIAVTSTFNGPTSPLDVLRISEINYNPADPSPTESAAGFTNNEEFEFIELVNIGSTTVSLSDVLFEQINGGSEGLDFDFSTGAVTSLEPDERVVIVENLAAFESRYGTGLQVAGQWSGGLSNSSETLTVTVNGTILHQFAYDDDWYPSTDNGGYTLQIIDATNPDLASWAQQASWRASALLGGTPGAAEAPPLPGDYNTDGSVTVADYVLWNSTFGSTTDLRADGNENNVVDTADYAIWRDHLGQTTPASVAAPVEASGTNPATTSLLAASWPLPLESTTSSISRAVDHALASLEEGEQFNSFQTIFPLSLIRETDESRIAIDLALREISEENPNDWFDTLADGWVDSSLSD
ncbi:MAG: lamin tail domain-containing protein, partial [Aeoliella sp.]